MLNDETWSTWSKVTEADKINYKKIISKSKKLFKYAEKYGEEKSFFILNRNQIVLKHSGEPSAQQKWKKGKFKNYYYNYPVHTNLWSKVEINIADNAGIILINYNYIHGRGEEVTSRIGLRFTSYADSEIEVFTNDTIPGWLARVKKIEKWLINPEKVETKTSAKAGK